MQSKRSDRIIIKCPKCNNETYIKFSNKVKVFDVLKSKPEKQVKQAKMKCYWCKAKLYILTNKSTKVTYADGIISPEASKEHMFEIIRKRLSKHYGDEWNTFSPDEKHALISQQMAIKIAKHRTRFGESTYTGGSL